MVLFLKHGLSEVYSERLVLPSQQCQTISDNNPHALLGSIWSSDPDFQLVLSSVEGVRVGARILVQ